VRCSSCSLGLPQFSCTELLYVSYHWEKLITKTKILALGADIRVCMGSEEHSSAATGHA
jgi:hypothetical protein